MDGERPAPSEVVAAFGPTVSLATPKAQGAAPVPVVLTVRLGQLDGAAGGDLTGDVVERGR